MREACFANSTASLFIFLGLLLSYFLYFSMLPINHDRGLCVTSIISYHLSFHPFLREQVSRL